MSISSSSVRKGPAKKAVELCDDAKGAVSVIKGLISSRKRITTVKDLEKEYKELEGQNVPHEKWGYSKLEDLLRSSGMFHVSNRNKEEVIVSLKLSKNNESVANQVQSNKKSMVK